MNERPDILITGATGFIGSHLATRLARQNRPIRCLVRASSPEAARRYLRSLGAELVDGDLLEPRSLDAAVAGVTTVFHLGGGGRIGMREEICHAINVEGTRNLLDACVGRGGMSKFVHLSTCAVMGDVTGRPADETHPYNPQRIGYSRAKTGAEKIALARKDRLPLVVVRVPGVIGAPLVRLAPEQIGGVTPLLGMLSAVGEGRWRTIGDGRNVFHTVAVQDAVRGLELAAERGSPGEIYIVAGEKAVTIDRLIAVAADALGAVSPSGHIPAAVAHVFALLSELRARLFGSTPMLTREIVRGFTGNLAVDISKARRELGYEPRVGVGQAVGEAVAWYEGNGYLDRPEPAHRQSREE